VKKVVELDIVNLIKEELFKVIIKIKATGD
jgi:hypothetical protein